MLDNEPARGGSFLYCFWRAVSLTLNLFPTTSMSCPGGEQGIATEPADTMLDPPPRTHTNGLLPCQYRLPPGMIRCENPALCVCVFLCFRVREGRGGRPGQLAVPADGVRGVDRDGLQRQLLHQLLETPVHVCGRGEPRRPTSRTTRAPSLSSCLFAPATPCLDALSVRVACTRTPLSRARILPGFMSAEEGAKSARRGLGGVMRGSTPTR